MTETDPSPADNFRFGQVVPRTPNTPPLDALAAFTNPVAGRDLTFTGQGFNTIFRPQSPASPTVLANNPLEPVQPGPPPFTIADNILELNLTEETLTFRPPLGLVPNRGEIQADAFLNGIPYQQVINDVTDQYLNPNAQPTGVHFEPGLWMNLPDLDDPSKDTYIRMASIPHGTTINAQGSSSGPAAGKPAFDRVDITPAFIKPPPAPAVPAPFSSQTVANNRTFRLPQDLGPFDARKAITQEILDNPNVLLDHVAQAVNIRKFTTLTISTRPLVERDGGTGNIAFLLGDQTAVPPTPNADATQMTATFWIETVDYQVIVPAFTPGQEAIIVSPVPPVDVDGRPVLVPRFRIEPPFPILEPVTIAVEATQIQYSQNVTLDFAGLHWPHVTVATLIPKHPVPVPRETWLKPLTPVAKD
jgi:hypothetical protein